MRLTRVLRCMSAEQCSSAFADERQLRCVSEKLSTCTRARARARASVCALYGRATRVHNQKQIENQLEGELCGQLRCGCSAQQCDAREQSTPIFFEDPMPMPVPMHSSTDCVHWTCAAALRRCRRSRRASGWTGTRRRARRTASVSGSSRRPRRSPCAARRCCTSARVRSLLSSPLLFSPHLLSSPFLLVL